MSARQLKKLKGYDQTAELKKMMGVGSGSEEEEAPRLMKPPKKKNLGFASLIDDDLSEDEDEELEEEPIPAVKVVQSSKKSKKKNKKKKKAAQKEADFDSILAEYRENQEEPRKESVDDSIVRKMASCLRIDSKFLDPDAELKRIFGNAAVNADRTQKKGRQHQRKLRGSILVNGNSQGPVISGGLGCSEDEKQQKGGDVCWWKFTHNAEYQKMQGIFLKAIKGHDHEALMVILRKSPSHADATLALSDTCRLQDDTNASKELLERLLYLLEQNLHPRCSIGSGKNRFDYNRPENRPLFGALFRYCQLSARRGCWRTALEQAKLLLSFDPIKDPLASVLLIPLFAVRCGQFHELIEMEQELAHRNVESMPNWCLAIALAYVYLDQPGLAQQRVEECLKRFPGLLLKVLSAIQAEPGPEIATSPFFNSDEGEARKLLYDLICQREVDLWKETKAQQVLTAAAQSIVALQLPASKNKFNKVPPQIMRHCILSDASVSNLRPEESYLFDPYPPKAADQVVSYTPVIPTEDTTMRGFNSIAESFLQSLVPGFEDMPRGAGADGNPNTHIQNVMDSISAMLDQMRIVRGADGPTENAPDEPDAEDEFD